MSEGTTGAYLNKLWKVGAAHSLYLHSGVWFHRLRRFPGALFDQRGYVLFETEEVYLHSPQVIVRKHTRVREPGICALPNYVRVLHDDPLLVPFKGPDTDVDIHDDTGSLEGRKRLVAHLQRERDPGMVRKKKKSVTSLECEVCRFSFRKVYGKAAEKFCEVHHLLPLKDAEGPRRTRLEDLAILCANCHRVVHLHNPPFTLDHLRQMLAKVAKQNKSE
jgi:hypothetical protein